MRDRCVILISILTLGAVSPVQSAGQPTELAVVHAVAQYLEDSEGALRAQLDGANQIAVDPHWVGVLEASRGVPMPDWRARSVGPIDEELVRRVSQAVGGAPQAHQETVRCDRVPAARSVSCSLLGADLFLRLSAPHVDEQEGEARIWISVVAASDSPRQALWVRVFELSLVEVDGSWTVDSERVVAVT